MIRYQTEGVLCNIYLIMIINGLSLPSSNLTETATLKNQTLRYFVIKMDQKLIVNIHTNSLSENNFRKSICHWKLIVKTL